MNRVRMRLTVVKIVSLMGLVSSIVAPLNSAHAADLPGLLPQFSNWIPQNGGYTVNLLNFDSSYLWTFSSASGQVTPDVYHYKLSVTGAAPGLPTTLTVTTSRTGYASQSAQISGDVLGLKWPYTPVVELISQSDDGFTAQIQNYDPSVHWSGIATVGNLSLSNSGVITVSNLKRGQSSTITLSLNKFGYVTEVFPYAATSQPPPLTLVPSVGTPTATGQVVSIPITNFDGYFDWTVTSTAGLASIDKKLGIVSLSGLTLNQIASVTITDSHGGQVIGKTTFLEYLNDSVLTLKPTFDIPVAQIDSFQVQVNNYNPLFTWDVSASAGTATIDSGGLIAVSGLQRGQASTIQVTSYILGGSIATSSLNVSVWPSLGQSLLIGPIHQSSDGFSFQITDFNRFYDYTATVDAGQVSLTGGGFGQVSGLIPGQKAEAIVTIGKSGQNINTTQLLSAAVLEVQIMPVVTPTPVPIPLPTPVPLPTRSLTPKPTLVVKKATPTLKKTIPVQVIPPLKKKRSIVTPTSSSLKQEITIICLKGTSHKFVTSTTPKCPDGFVKQK